MPPISVTVFASDPGTYYLEDDGIPGNNFSRIRFPDGTTVAFEHPTDDLFFDPSVAGITLVINLVDTLGTSRFSTGDFADPLSTPDFIQVRNIVTAAGVTLIANNAIIEFGSDTGADIVASTLVMSSTTGVGTAVNALETQVGVIEAEANTGGINVRNFGTVSIGGLTADVDGLDVITSGNINFTAFGSIVISDESGPESIHGGTTSGNVTLTASGVDSDVIANIDQDSISAPTGNITVTAGRDIIFGLIGTNFDNDVRASGNVVFNPGRDLLLDGFADVVSDAFGNATGGDVIANAGRNVTLLAVAGTDAGIEAGGTAGANIILNTGPGGTVTLNSGNGTAPFASLISQTGDIVINADRLSIGTNGAISTVNGSVTVRPRSEGWEIDVGSATDAAFALEISDAEIDRIFTTTLTVGSLTSGQLTVSSAISPLNALNMALRSGTDIGINASMTVGGALSLLAGDNFFQSAVSAINIGGAFNAIVDHLGDDGNVGAFGTFAGTLTASAVTVSGNGDKDFLNGTGAAETLIGLASNDTLIGNGGNDTLIGGTGNDSMNGGTGNDIIHVDTGGDVVLEAVGEGTDVVYASASYALAAGAEIETLSTSVQAATTAINLVGNEFDQTIYGNAGANILDGAGGADMLIGLGGNDIYHVNNAGDVVFEAAAGGTDVVYASTTYTLAAAAQVETLSTNDQAAVVAINLNGNGFAQTIYGNAGANVLNGLGGNDLMVGLGGNDTYHVDAAGDGVFEGAAGGNDVVYSGVTYTLTAGQEVETLSTSSQAAVIAINLTGNALAQTIYGNAGANVLNGLGGNDILVGLAGTDTFAFTTALGAGNVDSISGFSVADDTIQLENAVFTGLAAGALAAGAFNTGAAATQADDRIIYNNATGALLFDVDGVGGAAGVQFATLATGLAMTAADFIVI